MIETVEETGRRIQGLLASWQGRKARLWEFTASHDTLTLRLFADDRPGNLHLTCSACRHLTAPVYWEKCRLELSSSESPEGEVVFELKDLEAGFRVVCGAVEAAEDIEPLY